MTCFLLRFSAMEHGLVWNGSTRLESYLTVKTTSAYIVLGRVSQVGMALEQKRKQSRIKTWVI